MKIGSFLRKGAALVGVLLLSGCSEEFATLEFDDGVERAVTGNSGALNENLYQVLVLEALANVGVGVDQLEIVRPPLEPTKMKIYFKNRSVDPHQGELIRGYLEQLLADRKVASFAATLDIYSKKNERAHNGSTLGISRVPNNTRLELLGQPMIRVSAVKTGRYKKLFSENEQQCEFRYSLRRALPIRTLRVIARKTENEKLPAFNAEVSGKYRRDEWTFYETLPANLMFDDKNMAQLVSDGRVRIDMSDSFRQGFQEMRLIMGGVVNGDRHHVRYKQCSDLINALGRPFSFFVGDSMERLSGVTYK